MGAGAKSSARKAGAAPMTARRAGSRRRCMCVALQAPLLVAVRAGAARYPRRLARVRVRSPAACAAAARVQAGSREERGAKPGARRGCYASMCGDERVAVHSAGRDCRACLWWCSCLSPRAGAPIFSCACPSNVQKSVPALRWRVHHVEPPLATSMEEKRNWARTGLGLRPPLLVTPLTPVDCVTLSPRRTECGAAEGLRVSSITPL